MAHSRRAISAKTRVKLSQAAKRRKRGIKGTSLGGKFLAGIHTAGKFRSADIGGPEDKGYNPKSAGGGHTGHRVHLVDPTVGRSMGPEAQTRNRKLVDKHPDEAARRLARNELDRSTGRVRVDPSKEATTRLDIEHPPVRVRSGAQRQINDMLKSNNWEKGEGAYATQNRKTPQKFIEEDMAPEHRQKYNDLLNDPSSEFWKGHEDEFVPLGKGPRPSTVDARVRKYTDTLQQGKSHEYAYSNVRSGRGRPAATGRRTPPGAGYAPKKTPARKSRYESAQPRANEFEFGISGKSVEKFEDLKKRMPDATDDELYRVQQWQREDIFSDLQKNQKWAHETQKANIMGQKGGKTKEDDDRVVFFTTNLGSPAPSVPADSLVGQYIIGKRKKMMKAAGVPKSQLRGAFPQAVRDMHLFERSFGVQYAVEGRHGTYKQSGWRFRNKTSPGYGKPTPLGSQIMYDSSTGTPMYDAQGNIRFTEGATRPFRAETPLAGLRIFIG